MEQQLDDRKRKILLAIIRNYLETGEPVGSRTISKYTDLNLSSATIRNEMADLEELGYILQPHTSAGRIPSDKGYRFYVDSLMGEKMQEVEEMKEMLFDRRRSGIKPASACQTPSFACTATVKGRMRSVCKAYRMRGQPLRSAFRSHFPRHRGTIPRNISLFPLS